MVACAFAYTGFWGRGLSPLSTTIFFPRLTRGTSCPTTIEIRRVLRSCAPSQTEGPSALSAHELPQLKSQAQTNPQLQPQPPGHETSFRTLRVVLTVISLTGAAESLFLTLNKIFSSPGSICSTEGCLDVLTGPFSVFLGIPLSLIGTVSYLAFAYLSAWPLTATDECPEDESFEDYNVHDKDDTTPTNDDLRENAYGRRDAATRPLMLALSTAQFVFTAYLVGLLKWVIRSMCPYCLFSAFLSTSIFVLTAFVGRAVPRWRPALTISALSTTVAAIAASISLIISWPAHIAAQPPDGPQAPPTITTRSDTDAMRIATKLAGKQSTMYGAYWCKHCYDQKQRFGKKAFGMLRYIECDKYGANTQYQLCRQKRIPGYPTWEIDGELFPGEIDLPELERLVDEASKP